MMWGKTRENGVWFSGTSDWRLMFWRHDALFIAAGRLRLRLMKRRTASQPSAQSKSEAI